MPGKVAEPTSRPAGREEVVKALLDRKPNEVDGKDERPGDAVAGKPEPTKERVARNNRRNREPSPKAGLEETKAASIPTE